MQKQVLRVEPIHIRRPKLAQVNELKEILKQNVRWRVVSPGVLQSIRDNEVEFANRVLCFIANGGRMPLPLLMSEDFGHMEKTTHVPLQVLVAMNSVTWYKLSRSEVQRLIDTPIETGLHFTCFLVEWKKDFCAVGA